MCGKELEHLIDAKVEGVEMQLCGSCAKYGTRIEKEETTISAKNASIRPSKKPQAIVPQQFEYVDIHAGRLLKKKREEMGMRQKDMARFLNEKESLIHQLESGHIKPSQKLLDKLKAKLGLDLLRETTAKKIDRPDEEATEGGGFTIGDLMKNKA
jgi:putative transcription factor